MKRTIISVVMCGVMAAVTPVVGQSREEEVVREASLALEEIMAVPLNAIPAAMLADAHGVAIIPDMIKGGFVIGVRRGRGVLVVREPNGNWGAPVFVTVTGGNVGWQAGLQASDVILVFKTQRSVQGILEGTFTLGADASAAAGPVGRQAAAATDGRLRAEIYTYSRSRGLFAGVAIDGSVLQIDNAANAAYYRAADGRSLAAAPASATQLVNRIARYCNPAATGAPAGLAAPSAASKADALGGQLRQLAPQLHEVLDAPWAAYLALPPELMAGTGHPSPESLNRCIERYEAVARDPRYQDLTRRAEFQSVLGVLRHYAASRTSNTAPLNLPPPPGPPR